MVLMSQAERDRRYLWPVLKEVSRRVGRERGDAKGERKSI